MKDFFNYATPVVYWVLIIVWAAVFIFYIVKIRALKEYSNLFKLLLVILAIDAFRSFFESVYFGAWYTSYSGLLPISVFNFLADPRIVFIPKIINLIVVLLILFLIVKKWLVYELDEVNKIKKKIHSQGIEINRLKVAVEQSGNSIVITDTDGNIEYTNPKFSEITGYSAEEALGANPRILSSGNRDKAFYKEMWDTISNGGVWSGELINKTKNGTIYWEQATISPVKNEEGNIISYLAIKEDISSKKMNEEMLSEQKLLFEVMFNSLTDAVVITDKNRNIVLANKGIENTFGYLPSEVMGENTSKFYANIEDYESKGEKVFSEPPKANNEFYIVNYKNKNNQIFAGETFGTKLLNTRGEWIGNLGIMRNVNERLNFIEEIKKAKEQAEYSNLLKTEFLNNMSHEIRTPMNGILGFSDMLSDPNLSSEKRNSFVNIIQNSGKQLLHIIDDILEISSLDTRQVKVFKEEVCLNDLFMETFSIFELKAKENKIPIYLNKGLSDRKSTVHTDISKLNKIITNLVENALKYTNEGFVEFGYEVKGDKIEIYIKDTGIGIEECNHESIFERFSQVEKDLTKKTGGLGLGLSIVKENVELLGGQIKLISNKESGSTFFVILPYEPVYVNDVEVEAKNIPIFLMVEDEEVNALYLEALLEQKYSLGCVIQHAKNGEEAVQLFKNNSDFDMVLMDLKMPIMDGYEATKRIKELNSEIPVLALTAYSTNEQKDNAKLVGCDDFISKPINSERLNTVLDSYLKMKYPNS